LTSNAKRKRGKEKRGGERKEKISNTDGSWWEAQKGGDGDETYPLGSRRGDREGVKFDYRCQNKGKEEKV